MGTRRDPQDRDSIRHLSRLGYAHCFDCAAPLPDWETPCPDCLDATPDQVAMPDPWEVALGDVDLRDQEDLRALRQTRARNRYRRA